jgi:hypothetical protein
MVPSYPQDHIIEMDYRLPPLQHQHSDSHVSQSDAYSISHDDIDPDLLSLRSGGVPAKGDDNNTSGVGQTGNSVRSGSVGEGGTNADGTPVIRRLA